MIVAIGNRCAQKLSYVRVCTELIYIIHALRLNISLGHQGVAEPAVFYLLQGMFQNGFKT